MSRHRFSIRRQLVLIAIAVLSLPYVAYDYVREMESFLREGLEVSLAGDASMAAGFLVSKADSFPEASTNSLRSLFIHPMRQVVQVDGYTEDWDSLLQWAEVFSSADGKLTVKVLIAQRDQERYLLFYVNDENLIYQSPDQPFEVQGDQIELLYHDEQGDRQHWWLAPAAPGQIGIYEQGLVWDETIWEPRPFVRKVTNAHGFWQEHDQGYSVELRMPENVLAEDLGFIIHDVDVRVQPKKATKIDVIESFDPEQPQLLNHLVSSSDQLNAHLHALSLSPGRRIWVLDQVGNVLATRGSLRNPDRRQFVNRFYRLILPSVNDRFRDELQGASRLQGQEVLQALSGKAALRWRSSSDEEAAIVSAAQPIRFGENIIGAVIVEETTGNLQMVQRQALANLFTRTLLVFVFVTLLLLIFSASLSRRIRRLSRDANAAIDINGRVVETEVGKPWADELGDLSQQYSLMLKRLSEHHDYLESLAGKLSHELQTPMAVVQSSLENLANAEGDERLVYLTRAREGIARLQRLTVRLSEAAHLDQALRSADYSVIELDQLLDQCVKGYRNAYPSVPFEFNAERHDTIKGSERYSFIGVPDLLVQMLDKLVSNAVEYAQKETPIKIALRVEDDEINSRFLITIDNSGPAFNLPKTGEVTADKKARLSLHQVPHLGIGLYIAQQISEFHGGTLSIDNTEKGVQVSVSLISRETVDL